MRSRCTRPLRNDVKGDRRKRTEAHRRDLEADEIDDAVYGPRTLETPAVDADEADLLGEALHDGLRLRIVRAKKNRDSARREHVDCGGLERSRTVDSVVD